MNFILLLVVMGSTAFADWTKISPHEFELAPPPAAGSTEYRQDFEVLLAYQESRTDGQCRLAEYQKWPSYRVMFGKSNILSKEEVDRTEPLMKRVFKYSEKVSLRFKEEYQRPRPYEVDARIEPCVEKPGGSKAYPSTHGTTAATVACVLGEIFADREADLAQYGDGLGELRVIVGVHHPSDVEAGQKLGAAICARLMQDADFQNEVRQLQ